MSGIEGGRPPLAAVLIDHDGTLVDSEPVHYEHWLRVLAGSGFELTEAIYRTEFAGVPTEGNAELLVTRYGGAGPAAALVARKLEVTGDYLRGQAFPLVEGGAGVLADLQARGLAFGVVTGAGPEAIAATIRYYGLAERFAVVVTGADVVHSKPAPDCYRLALTRLGVAAEHCVAIEDSAAGVAAATGAGIDCVAIRTPFTAAHDFSAAVAVFDRLTEAVDWIIRERL
ncbi:MAG: HAD family hydrolase [Lautropia sp.]